MSGPDFIVPARKWDDIETITQNIRAQFGLLEQPKFPIMEFLEMVVDHQLGVHFQVDPPSEMGAAEGYTDPHGTFIILREDVYNHGLYGQGRARFTAAHEFGHLVLHTNVPLARTAPGQQVEAFRMAEPQANQFAAALLMPLSFIKASDSVDLVISRHGVSHDAAATRLSALRKRGKI